MRKTSNLKKINFLSGSAYESVVESDNELYAVEFPYKDLMPVFPEYKQRISLNIGKDFIYTVGNGILSDYSVGWVWYGGGLGTNRTFIINDVTFELAYYNGGSGYDSKLLFHPVAIGDKFYAVGDGELYFVPCAGDV